MIPSTVEILAFKALKRDIDKSWVDWAVDLLMDGFDSEYLVILAGMSAPYDQLEMQGITDKVLQELGLDYSDEDRVIEQYVRYLVKKGLDGDIDTITVLARIKDLYLELDHMTCFQQFYSFYYAKLDLIKSEQQWYVDGVDRNNIDQEVLIFFSEWLTNPLTNDHTDNPAVLPAPKSWWQRLFG